MGHTNEIVRLIETEGVDPNGLDQYKLPPLHRAVNKNQVSAAQMLVYLGADLHATGKQDRHECALHWACRNGSLELVKSLISMGGDIEQRDVCGWAALHHACSQRDRGSSLLVAHYLVSVGASISEQDQDGRTPLHLASAAGNSDLCFYLVTHGASVHSFDRKGKTPAQCASAHVPELGKLLQADDDTAINALAPWHHFGTTFKRPNEQASAKDFALPMACVPVIFYSFGALYWWLSIVACSVLMYFVGGALQPTPGKKVKAQPTLHAFYIGCVLMTYSTWFSVVGLGRDISVGRLFLFLVSSICLFICFFIASYTDPGVLKPNSRDYNDVLIAVARGLSLDGFCATCAIRKPTRSKHCSVLDACVAQFDHFCPWCNNAIGSKNYLGFVGWCFFEAVCHLQLVYDLWAWLLKEIRAESTFPLVHNLVAINELHPTVLYLVIFNVMSLAMACQLIQFQTGNIKVSLTTNERMNAFRYTYLQQFLPAGLVGNPYDRGGFQANFMFLLRGGLMPPLPKLQYKSIEFDIDCKVGSQLDPWEGGTAITVGKGKLDVAGAHRWMVQEQKRASEMTGEARAAKHEDLRYNFMGVLRRLSEYPEFLQRKYLSYLIKTQRQGLLQEQVDAVVQEVEAQKGHQGHFGMSEQEKQLLAKIGGAGHGDMAQGADGMWRRREEGRSSQLEEQSRKEMQEKQVKMMMHMVEQQTKIAEEVMDAEQFAIFQKGVIEMERHDSIQDKQTAMQDSQRELKGLLSEAQQHTIQERIQGVMQAYVAEHGHPTTQAAPAALEPVPTASTDQSDSDGDSSGFSDDSDEDEDDDLVVRQTQMVNLMLETQRQVAQAIMNEVQIQVFSQGYDKIQQAQSLVAKQAANEASKQQWHPLLSPEQQVQMETQMKEAMTKAMSKS